MSTLDHLNEKQADALLDVAGAFLKARLESPQVSVGSVEIEDGAAHDAYGVCLWRRMEHCPNCKEGKDADHETDGTDTQDTAQE